MGTNLIKWRGGDDDIQALVKRARNILDANEQAKAGSKALTVRSVPRRVSPPDADHWQAQQVATAGAVSGIESPPIIELPRWCAVYDELWLAAYEPGRNGDYEFVTSRELPKHQQSRYAQENIIALPAGFHTDVERCACCETWTLKGSTGAVLCGRCGARVCYGRTSQSHFRCRQSCGSAGELGHGEPDARGLMPHRRGGNLGTKF